MNKVPSVYRVATTHKRGKLEKALHEILLEIS